MLRFSQIVLILSLSLFVMWGCAAVKVEKKTIKEADLPGLHKEVVIYPSRSFEECIELLSTHVMDYSFKASKPVTFNIHYHTEKEVLYPVLKEGVSEWSGVINVAEEHYYTVEQEYFCLMWENPYPENVSVTFECKVREE